ncbi:WD40-repeat-containing domain protein [Yarrowia lipolytica]|nr:WD40-repeat-containing domain protein [Yarrowia lipolytica]
MEVSTSGKGHSNYSRTALTQLTSFGKQQETSNLDHKLSLALREDFKHRNQPKGQQTDDDNDDDDDGDDDDDDDDDDELDELPISHELFASISKQPVSCLVQEKSGSRLILATGRKTEFYDFPTLDKPFREVDQDAQVTCLAHDPSNIVLAVSETKKVKIYSRDGQELAESVEGDMYLVTPQNTKGHTATVLTGIALGGCEFVTSSRDQTVRIWKYTPGSLKQTNVIVTKTKGVKKVAGDDSGVVYHLAALAGLIVAATKDSLITYSKSNGYSRSMSTLQVEVTSLTSNSTNLVVTTTDKSLKILSKDLKVQLETNLDEVVTSTAYSPDSKYIVAVSDSLRILDSSDLAEVYKCKLRSPAKCVSWHAGLNQICLGLENGQLQMLFSPELSSKGALAVLERGHRKRDIDDVLQTVDVSSTSLKTVNPFADDFHKDNQKRKKQAASHHPDNKLDVWGTPDQKHVDATTDKAYRQDPREELLKYAEKAKNSDILERK